jgi:hypothetical protein
MANPADIKVVCREDGVAINRTETGSKLVSGDNKTLQAFLCLDYTISMADRDINGDTNNNKYSDALETMETSAKALIGSLHSDGHGCFAGGLYSAERLCGSGLLQHRPSGHRNCIQPG